MTGNPWRIHQSAGSRRGFWGTATDVYSIQMSIFEGHASSGVHHNWMQLWPDWGGKHTLKSEFQKRRMSLVINFCPNHLFLTFRYVFKTKSPSIFKQHKLDRAWTASALRLLCSSCHFRNLINHRPNPALPFQGCLSCILLVTSPFSWEKTMDSNLNFSCRGTCSLETVAKVMSGGSGKRGTEQGEVHWKSEQLLTFSRRVSSLYTRWI